MSCVMTLQVPLDYVARETTEGTQKRPYRSGVKIQSFSDLVMVETQSEEPRRSVKAVAFQHLVLADSSTSYF